MKELTVTFNALLQDKRVRSEQSKYETIQKQRSMVINRYKRAYQEFLDLTAGLHSAKNWYGEMREAVESLDKNVESFVNNRRSEGAQLLNQIEEARSSNKSAQAELERERLRGLMERMSVEQTTSPAPGQGGPGRPARPTPAPLFPAGQGPRFSQQSASYQGQQPYGQQPTSPPATQAGAAPQQAYQGYSSPVYGQPTYDPSQYGRTPGPTSPPPNQSTFGVQAMRGPASPPPNQASFGQMHQQGPQGAYGGYGGAQTPQQTQGGYMPAGYVPPPPPPGPPPLGPQQTVYTQQQQQQQQQGYGVPSAQPQPSQTPQPHDPWAGLNAWK